MPKQKEEQQIIDWEHRIEGSGILQELPGFRDLGIQKSRITGTRLSITMDSGSELSPEAEKAIIRLYQETFGTEEPRAFSELPLQINNIAPERKVVTHDVQTHRNTTKLG